MAETRAADQLPDVDGRDLGAPDRRWDGFFKDLNVSGNFIGNFTGVIATGGLQIVPFSVTPVFDATSFSNFKITLTGNVTGGTFTGASVGQAITFIIVQDATGGRTFVWPTNVRGGMQVGLGPNEVSVQSFIWEGSFAYARAPGAIYP